VRPWQWAAELPRRRWRFAAGLAALAGAVWVVWWVGAWSQAYGDPGPAAATPLPASPTSTVASAAGPLSSARSAESAPSALGPVAAQAGPDQGEGSTDPAAESVWDLCGVGRMPKPAHAAAAASASADFALQDLPAHLGRDALQQARQALLRALDAGSPRWQAAAMMLRAPGPLGQPAVPGLPALALAADDPVIHLWALHSCGQHAACAEPVARRWAQHDANNLAAWAAVLERTPVPQQDQVVARMAQATRNEAYGTALSVVVMQAMPEDVPAYLQVPLLLDALSLGATWVGGLQSITTYCREPLRAGSTAFANCAAVARVMVARSDTMIGSLVGLRLAERTYLPASEAQRQRDAIRATSGPSDLIFDARQPLSCAGLRGVRNWVQLMAQHGELGALKALVKAHATPAPAR
jgi:hypothetical protein